MFLTAVSPTSQIINSLISSLSSVADEMIGAVSSVVPIAVPVIGGILVVNLGIKIFKIVTGDVSMDEVDMPSDIAEEYDSWEDYFDDNGY